MANETKTEQQTQRAVPTLAICGRPNVGKSTLFNRLVGQRRAIVGDEPGITRDRLYGEIKWAGREMRVIDTGGIIPDDEALIPSEIFRQARVALEEAAAIVMVVDVRTELASPDYELARMLIRTGKPLFLAVNKVDSPKLEAEAENYRTLGIKNLYSVSAEHGTGVADLIEAVMDAVNAPAEIEEPEYQPPTEEEIAAEIAGEEKEEEAPSGPVETKVAIIGRPNVGKSTLLNRLTGTSRAIVSPIAGTTRDAVDELVKREEGDFRFIDTAGIRRKGKTNLMAEKLSVVMARKHLEAADIALLVVDATEGVTALDATIGGYAHESGRSVIVVINKWDLLTTHRKDQEKPPADRNIFEQQARRALKFLDYAPMVFISAHEGKNTDKIWPLLAKVASERRKRIPTGEMNRFLKHVDFERAPVPMNKRVKVYYMTQAHTSPPTFILFTDKAVKLHFSYERYLQNQIRRSFGFEGTPIWIKTRESGR